MKKEIKNDKIYITTNYNKKFISLIKKIGGRWNGETWEISQLSEENINEILLKCFNTTGDENEIFLQIKFKAMDFENEDIISFKGYTVAQRQSRDSEVQLFNETSLVQGVFSGSGGSSNHPKILADENIILTTILNKKLFEKLSEEEKEKIEIIKEFSKISEKSKDDLLKELETLKKRIQEIEKILEMK